MPAGLFASAAKAIPDRHSPSSTARITSLIDMCSSPVLPSPKLDELYFFSAFSISAISSGVASTNTRNFVLP